MRNLTELLQEIPLDEMTGGLDIMNNSENKNNITMEKTGSTMEKTGGAKVRSKAPAAIAVAACAVLAVTGAVYFGGKQKPAPETSAAGHTTDAEDLNGLPGVSAPYLTFIPNGSVNSGFENVKIDSSVTLYNDTSDIVMGVRAVGSGDTDMASWDTNGNGELENYEMSGPCNFKASGSIQVNGKEYKCEKIGMSTCTSPRWYAMGYYRLPKEALQGLTEDTEFRFVINEVHSLAENGDEDGCFDSEGEYAAEFTYGDLLAAQKVTYDTEGEGEDTKAENEALAHLGYENKGYNYDLIKDNVTVIDQKLGEVEYYSDKYDLRVSDIKVSYPFVEVDLVLKRLDGSSFDAEEDRIGLPMEYSINGNELAATSNYGFEVYGDTAVSRQVFDLEKQYFGYQGDLTEEGSTIHFEAYAGWAANEENDYQAPRFFSVDVPLDDYVDVSSTPSDAFTIRPDVKTKWHYLGLTYGNECDVEFTVNELTLSAGELTVNVTAESEQDIDSDALALELICDEGRSLSDESFVNVEFKDGTTEQLKVTADSHKKNEDGSLTLYYNTMENPYDYSDVAALTIGSARIPIDG